MARENKRKREARRFGESDRLIDKILTTPADQWSFPRPLAGPAGRQIVETAKFFQQRVAQAIPIEASNVGEFYYTTPKNDFDYMADFPSPMPPFRNLFIEMGRPSKIVCNDNIYAWPDDYPHKYGCLVMSGSLGQMPIDVLPGASALLEEAKKSGDPHSLICQVGFTAFAAGLPYFGMVWQWLCLDKQGRVLSRPYPGLPGRFLGDEECATLARRWYPLFQSVTLAQSFVNCKNVKLLPVEPDARLNRERVMAGRKPFVRYHTLEIDPMKAVLRTEGGIEANGLKKALHICRGHFATYTEDKPLFGHFTGTVWKQAHVRGTAKAGVVVKDYRVNAPTEAS